MPSTPSQPALAEPALVKPVAVIMGSQSDWSVMRHTSETLDALEIGHDALIVSAHRTPDRLWDFARGAKAKGFQIVIAGAGGAAHLPGMTAAMTPLPVFGVPIPSPNLGGRDSLYSIVQMPGGVPVGTLAIGKAGAINAALLAAAVLALHDAALALAARRLACREERRRRAGPTGRAVTLAPGATIGILGGGQLGRMLTLAAARLGLRTHVYCPDPDSPAFEVASEHTVAAYEDEAALRAFAAKVEVVTYEFENVPARTAHVLAAVRPVRPDAAALAASQDRLVEKQFLASLGIATAPFVAVDTAGGLPRALAQLGRPSILKTRRFGYDGKGQTTIKDGSDIAAAFRSLGGGACILEGIVPFSREGVRRLQRAGSTGRSPPSTSARTRTRNHILHRTLAPAAIAPATAAGAVAIAKRIADALAYVGVLAVEFFVIVRDGGRASRRQRDRPARPQFRALDRGRRGDIAVRAARARDLRLAARHDRAARHACRDGEFDRNRCGATGRRCWRAPASACISTARTRCGPAARWGIGPG